jgi:hypothetical protein
MMFLNCFLFFKRHLNDGYFRTTHGPQFLGGRMQFLWNLTVAILAVLVVGLHYQVVSTRDSNSLFVCI